MGELRVLTVRQPWASAIAAGVKTVENRTRPTSYRGPIAIHAGLVIDEAARDAVFAGELPHLRAYLAARPLEERASYMPRGLVLAVARLVDVHWSESAACGCGDEWADRAMWHWCLADVERLDTPIPYRGALGLPRATPDLEEALHARTR